MARRYSSGAVQLPPIYGQKYHAVLMRPERVLSQAVFFQGLGDPEFYPRPDGDVYVCGFPDPPATVTEEPGAVVRSGGGGMLREGNANDDG